MDAWHYILIWVGFLFVSVAASQLAVVFPKIKLPLITGYLVIGIFAGPYVLNFLEKTDLPKLAPVNQFVLAFIGFSAGAELYLPELRDLFKSIFLSVAAISILTFGLVTGGVRLLLETSVASFSNDHLSPGCVTGIALLIGAIMTARSPASAIAIVKELKAKGPFTRTFLGITVVSDVVVLILFAISVSFARGQCTAAGFSGERTILIQFAESVLTLVLSLTLAVVLGYFVLGKLIVLLLYLKPNSRVPPKWLILPIGFGVFKLSEAIADATLEGIGFEINLEPLLMTIVSGYVATNQSRNRRLFLSMLQKLQSALLAVITMILRMIAIGVGSVIGGILARAPKKHTQYMWLSLITQAGVSLGLAGEINFQFHDTWGPACATSIVAVIMLNQIAGPILCKLSIKKVGEDGKAKGNEDDEGKGILILGINGYSLALAERLKSAHWRVTIADSNPTKLAFASRLNVAPGPDPNAQLSDAKAIQKKKKVYQNLEEDLEPVTLDSPNPPLSTIPPPPPPPPQEPIPPPPSSSSLPHDPHSTPAASATTVGHDEHEVIHDIQVVLIEDLDKSTTVQSEAVISKWNYRELAKSLEPKTDVVLCMLEPDSINVAACSFYKLQMKFVRVFGAVSSPTTLDMYLRTGAVPFYSLSATVNTLYSFVTANRVNVSGASSMIVPEAEGFPRNIELLPFLRPHPDDHEALEALDINSNLIDIDIESPSPASGRQTPEAPSYSSSNPMTRFGGMVRDSLSTTQARLRELRDPVGLVQRGVAQMHVVDDEQRDEYLDDIEALGDTMTRPVTTNSIWLDLLAPSPNNNNNNNNNNTNNNNNNNNNNNQRRVDQTYSDQGFRTDLSVFEQYQDMNDDSNNNRR